MPTPIPAAQPRRDSRPEPLRRKRIQPALPSSSTPRRRRLLNGLLAFATVVLFVDALVGDKGLLAMIQARQEFRALEQSLADVRSENARLRDEARRLREDPQAVEDLARRELGLMKPGEKLFIIRDVAPKDPQ
jgi:cell division protein FtsB